MILFALILIPRSKVRILLTVVLLSVSSILFLCALTKCPTLQAAEASAAPEEDDFQR